MAIKGITTQSGRKISFFQDGGAMPAEDPNAMPPEGAEAPAGGEDPMMMIAQAAAQALQTQDCQVALQVCQAFVELIQQAGAEPAPEQPVFKKGGILVRRIKK